jgi:hypothetical protein
VLTKVGLFNVKGREGGGVPRTADCARLTSQGPLITSCLAIAFCIALRALHDLNTHLVPSQQ